MKASLMQVLNIKFFLVTIPQSFLHVHLLFLRHQVSRLEHQHPPDQVVEVILGITISRELDLPELHDNHLPAGVTEPLICVLTLRSD